MNKHIKKLLLFVAIGLFSSCYDWDPVSTYIYVDIEEWSGQQREDLIDKVEGFFVENDSICHTEPGKYVSPLGKLDEKYTLKCIDPRGYNPEKKDTFPSIGDFFVSNSERNPELEQGEMLFEAFKAGRAILSSIPIAGSQERFIRIVSELVPREQVLRIEIEHRDKIYDIDIDEVWPKPENNH